MSATVLDGLALSKQIKEGLHEEVAQLKKEGKNPGLAVVIVEGDAASRVYVNAKRKDCEEIGVESYEYALSNETTEEELLALIDELNADDKVDAMLVQLPLPKHIDEKKVINRIRPDKDADCFHPENVGLLTTGSPSFLPCTPAGIMELIKMTGTEVAGKECVVLGRSNIVGKPMALLLLAANGTVTVCHSKTKDLNEVCKRADILIAAVGKANMVTADMVKPGAVVIDVGVSRTPENKLVGDVKFDEVKEVASAITKVTGGVGPMTRAMLMVNTVTAAKNKK